MAAAPREPRRHESQQAVIHSPATASRTDISAVAANPEAARQSPSQPTGLAVGVGNPAAVPQTPKRQPSPTIGRNVELSAHGLDAHGAGVCRMADREIHVPGLLPNETADVRIHHLSPHTQDAWGTVNRRLNDSEERVLPSCAGYGLCGGCSLQHMQYDAQLRWKAERLAHALHGIPGIPGGVSACLGFGFSPCDGDRKWEHGLGGLPLGYRSRVKLVAAHRATSANSATAAPLYFGSYIPRSHDVLAMDGCRINAPSLTALAHTLAIELNRLGVRAYDETTGQGVLRYVLLRESAAHEQQLSLVVAEPPSADVLAELTTALTYAHPQLVSMVLHVNRSPGNALLADEGSETDGDATDRLLHGPPYLWDEVGGLSLRISSRSFFQVNRVTAARIYSDVCAHVRSLLLPGPAQHVTAPLRIVDLFSGVGGLGLTLLRGLPGSSLLGVEWSASASADAQASAARLGLSQQADFRCGAVETVLADAAIRAMAQRCDALLLNPPRRGCTQDVLSAIVSLRPRCIVYVSCSPESLARDLSALTRAGYAWLQSTPYDMHPGTPHIESVTILRDAR